MEGSSAAWSTREYSEDEKKRVQRALSEDVTVDDVSCRAGPGGSSLTYLESWKVVSLANDVFGFDSWSCYIEHLETEYSDQSNGKWSVAAYAVVRVELPNGASHTDVVSIPGREPRARAARYYPPYVQHVQADRERCTHDEKSTTPHSFLTQSTQAAAAGLGAG